MHWYDTAVRDAKALNLPLFRVLLIVFFVVFLTLGFSIAHFINTIFGLLILVLVLPFSPQLVGVLCLGLLRLRRA